MYHNVYIYRYIYIYIRITYTNHIIYYTIYCNIHSCPYKECRSRYTGYPLISVTTCLSSPRHTSFSSLRISLANLQDTVSMGFSGTPNSGTLESPLTGTNQKSENGFYRLWGCFLGYGEYVGNTYKWEISPQGYLQ